MSFTLLYVHGVNRSLRLFSLAHYVSLVYHCASQGNRKTEMILCGRARDDKFVIFNTFNILVST